MALALQMSYVFWPVFTLGVDPILLRAGDARGKGGQAYAHLPAIGFGATIIAIVATRSPIFTLSMLLALGSAALMIARSLAISDCHSSRFLWLTIAWQGKILAFGIVLFLQGCNNPVLWILTYAVPAVVALPWLIRSAGRTARQNVIAQSSCVPAFPNYQEPLPRCLPCEATG